MTQATPNRFPWPPVLYLVAIAASVLANWFYPLPWIGSPLGDILFAIGALCIVGTLAIDLSAMGQLRAARTPILPTRAAEHLVTKGAFSFSRNPIYLANTLLMFGIGLVSGNVWFLLFGLVAAFATQKLAIEREERHLAQRFGKKYHDYAKRVRRWI